MSDPPVLELFECAPKGRQYEDFVVGERFVHHWGRTLTEADNVEFCTAMCHWSPMYLNREYARSHGHADMVLNPLLVLCVAVGLSVEDLSEGGGPFLGLNRCMFHRASYAGDTVSSSSTVTEKRLSSSRPGRGVVSWHTVVRDQHRELVLEFDRTNLVVCRGLT